MKKIFLAIIVIATASLIGFTSCDKADNPANPNMPNGSVNPLFRTDALNDSVKAVNAGGVYTVNVTQNTAYRWVVASNQAWATLNIATTDTVTGNKSFTITVDKNSDVKSRTAVVSLKEVSPKANRTVTVSVVQAGL